MSQILIFSDLDDTLLDHDSYNWKKARPALEYCIELNIPVILVSSKTRTEIRAIQKEMGFGSPFVSENGGGIFLPLTYKKDLIDTEYSISDDHIMVTLGKPYKDLILYLREMVKDTGFTLKGFSDMDLEEVMRRTGLAEDQCIRALERDFDEPFIIERPKDVDTKSLYASANKRGLKISEGGRFFHLHGESDKGDAMGWLISFYKKKHGAVYSIALGDSPNDFGMFDIADQPVLIKSARSFSDININERYPEIIITDKYGPEGWNEIVPWLVRTKREG